MTGPVARPVVEPIDPRVLALWGKAAPGRERAPGEPEWHPLLCHVLDVVACAERLLVQLQPKRLETLAGALGLPREVALSWLLLFVALHDLGKATPPFQIKVPARAAALVAMGLDFPPRDEPHGNLSVPLVTAALAELGVPQALGRWAARAVGAHHGEFVALRHLQVGPEPQKGTLLSAYGGKSPLWVDLRRQLVRAIVESCGIHATSPRPAMPDTPEVLHAFAADLAGLTTVADWLGSGADIFRYSEPPATVAAYLALARERAGDALERAGWRPSPVSPARTFHELFGKTPWPLHAAIEAILPTLVGPSLVIVEAPMGEGKTEAALAIYDSLASRGVAGLYFALPTQATSNQILGRVEVFLRSAFPAQVHGLHLVHGDAGLSDRYGALKERAFAMRAVGGLAGSVEGPVADAWFARSKRALLAPLAVGTVDQALLGVLGVRHGFLRLHGLAGKVVVVDEVHAYDTYTSELLDRLLSWLRALGATVVLLSATLPSARRQALLRAYGASPAEPAEYPRVTVANAGGTRSAPFPARRPPVPVVLQWRRRATLPALLADTLADGGCAVWIVNTVRNAQGTYRELRNLQARGQLPGNIELGLLHARFPFEARARREVAAEQSFGPREDARPQASILVGTQVLEQSLDLDFDLMISEVAPIDLVLQRAGRLHRHDRRKPRPAAVARPALWLVGPDEDERAAGPTFGASAWVYSEAVLLRTWLLLRARAEIILPADIEALIEAVYAGSASDAPEEVIERLALLDAAHREEALAASNQARGVVLPPPEAGDPFGDLARLYDDEDPTVHASLRAVTRLGEPTVDVVPVTTLRGRTVLAGAPDIAIDFDARDPLPHRVVIAAARQSIGVGRRGVVEALLNEPVPRAFETSGHLRYHRALWLDDASAAVVAGVPLRLDDDLGLVIGTLDEHGLGSELEIHR